MVGFILPSGHLPEKKLAFCGHDSTMCFANAGENPNVTTLKLAELPFVDLLWISENSVIAVGHECAPTLFSDASGSWALVQNLDQPKKSDGAAVQQSARAVFQNKVDVGQDARTGTKMETKHQNCINCIFNYKGSGDKVTDFTTSGVDGNVIFWNVKSFEQQFSGLKIK